MQQDVRAALRVSVAAVVWTIVTGALSVAVGISTGSTALAGTGADVLADAVSSVVLVWRFRHELRGVAGHAGAERRAQLVSSSALVVVAIGLATAAILRLAAGDRATPDGFGIGLAVAALVGLPAFAVVKLRIARRVGSVALRTDAYISIVGAATGAVTLIGLALTEGVGWTAADPVAALLIAAAAGTTGGYELRSAASGDG